ncbi:MAG: arginyltransferase [Pseudomonadota bacterium]
MGPNKFLFDDLEAALSHRRVPSPYYVLAETPCPYLPGYWERKVLTEIRGPDAAETYNLLSRAGFRRSHHFAYRPACDNCTACLPVRILAQDFRPSKSMKRILARNRDLAISVRPAEPTREQFDVFSRYIKNRHDDGEMAGMNFKDYCAMVEQSILPTELVEYRDTNDRLVGACLVDCLRDGPSAVYSFFEPDQSQRGLGTLMVLWLIQKARDEGRLYVYLGYWIQETPKMSYKIRFRPAEVLRPEGWARIDSAPEPVKFDGVLAIK